ncbi:hypothetical protein [Microbacterium sp. APC 3901]|uniref:hypothetical protein n=1 Tax=Microbacterium sp. APC 3901 TaxID=3035192 RepID=UPI0025B34AC7|nr:hypothetical protein [Microbacterium sp. APC 3901]MDN3443737.1 hypothetical protein [Microbacterium sp. APC 3901]
MTTFIEDSPRSFQAQWMKEACDLGDAEAVVLSPWLSPYPHRGGSGLKPGLIERTDELRGYGVEFWFDPMTHVHDMPGTRDYNYYSGYDLWGGTVADLTDGALRSEHVRKVFAVQDEIGARHLAPAPLLPTGLSTLSTISLDLARLALDIDPDAWLTISGLGPFWADGADLDAHIGSLAALTPGGWFLSFAQPTNDQPAPLTADQVFGICRTVRALSEHAPVYISHGDFAGLPAVAAGAFAVGTGWDKRQRVLSFQDYTLRETEGQGRWFTRPTLGGLTAHIPDRDGELLRARDAVLAASLGGLPAAPGARAAFSHHVNALSGIVARVVGANQSYEARARTLDAIYTDARTNWGSLRSSIGVRDDAGPWISPFQEGLRRYATSEGWTL